MKIRLTPPAVDKRGFGRSGGVRSWKVIVVLGALAVLGGLPWLVHAHLSDRQRDRDIMPHITFVSADTLKYAGCLGDSNCFRTKGAYVPAERRIYLRDDWSAENFDDLAILMHEFVHHLQTLGKLKYPCEREIELPAYAVQEAFHRAHGRIAGKHVPSMFTRFTRYSCMADE